MNKKIAILRGINVGGKRKILMADLKVSCQKLGWENVESYIQSGNLIFNSNEENRALETSLEKSITENYGFDVPVIVRDATELKKAVEKNPFYKADLDISQLHLTFLKSQPSVEGLEKIRTYDFEPDKMSISGENIYIFCQGKYHKSKLTNNFFERHLKTRATTRNWKTTLKLLELSQG